MNKAFRRGEIWWVVLGPSIGGEIRKQRPAVIVSNNAANTHLNRVQVIPLTTRTTKVYPSEALVMINGVPNKAMADQIMTAGKERFSNRICMASKKEMAAIDSAIRIQLSLT